MTFKLCSQNRREGYVSKLAYFFVLSLFVAVYGQSSSNDDIQNDDGVKQTSVYVRLVNKTPHLNYNFVKKPNEFALKSASISFDDPYIRSLITFPAIFLGCKIR